MSPRIAADDDMAKTFIATFRLNGPYRDIVHPDPRQIRTGEIILRMDEIDFYNVKPLRRDLFNPTSLIGKDPYVVSLRLEQERFGDE